MNDLDQFFSENSMSANTLLLYSRVLVLFSRHVAPATCTAGDVLDFLDSTGWGNSLRYVGLVAIKRFISWRFGETHPVLRLRLRRDRPKPGRVLSSKQALRLLASFDPSRRKGRRDLAIACLAIDTGLRVSELSSALFPYLDLDDQKLTVCVKGGRWEVAIFSDHTSMALAAWLPDRNPGDDRLFQITRDGLRVTVRRWGEKLGFRLSPHDLRRTFCVIALRAGAPSRLVQVAGRWSSIEMVERYSQSITVKDFRPYFPINSLMLEQSSMATI